MSTTVPSYRPLPGCYDEMVDAAGAPRPHWEAVASSFAELGLDELRRRQREAARLLDQDGVSYNAAPDSPRRKWLLDPVPVVVSSREWESIESAVIERAELLNMVLEDLYGPRELLRRGLIPPEVVFAHPGFLRPCDGIRLPGPQQLFNYAADLGRDCDGRWLVVADRTQAPSGSGYALENRTVISRVLPSLYRDAQVHRLAPFFRALRAALQEVAPPAVEEPRIVVLTPGPLNETAFEHAVLASSLGFTLVEGRDLTVRGDRVWMHSVGQLEPVDVILRRVDGWFCDPLELRADSHLGVPGLLEVARAGGVSVVNPLGSSVLENPALLPFLPRLAERLLGTELRMASVPSWWCGDASARRYVLEHLDRLVLRPVAPDAGGPASILGSELSAEERARVRRRIEERPGQWVGQEPLTMGSCPTLTAGGLESRRGVLRAFAVARAESYVVMPGGLTRVASDGGVGRISSRAGAIAKDTWVLASEPEPLTSFWLQSGPAVAAIDPMSAIPSRAAENLWWLGRYAERAEGTVRLLRTVQDRLTEFQGVSSPAGLATVHTLLAALTRMTSTYPGFSGEGAELRLQAPSAELLDLVVGERRPGTLAHAIRALLDNAHEVRDQLSRDTWLVLGPLERVVAELSRADGADIQTRAQAALGEVTRSLLALAGLGVESMVRDLGWRFMDAGRRLERAVQLLSLLRGTVVEKGGTAAESLLLESVLSAAESIITYRFRYRSQAQVETLLELLLLDSGNPRSLAYQLARLTEDLEALPVPGSGRMREEQRLVLEASTALRLADLEALAGDVRDGRRSALDAELARLLSLVLRTGDAVDRTHFVHLSPTFALVGPGGAEPSIGKAA